MIIIKSDGSTQNFFPNKILKRIKDQSKGLQVSPDSIFTTCMIGMVEEMTTADIDALIASVASEKITEHPDYSKLASRIIITRHGKIINVQPIDSDFLYDFKAIKSFLYKYSLRDDNANPTELPHMMYRRVCNYLKLDEETYDMLRFQKISLATPVLINAGTSRKAMISCNLTTLVDDSHEGIEKTLTDITYASKDGAGIGLHAHNLRSRHTLVSSFKGNAGGIVRFADMVQGKMRFYKQGNRSGSAALYLGVWHRDAIDFLELRLQAGEERWRTRDLFTAICIPDLFMEKLGAGDDEWYLFCPEEVRKLGFKQLHDTWGNKFKELYKSLVESGIGYKVSVKEIWNLILKSQVEAGLPYTFFWDNANRQNPHKHLGVCTGSNLCIEILQKSMADYTAQCCLGAVMLHNVKLNDFDDVRNRTSKLTIALNSVIDVNKWSTEAAKLAGKEQRAIGIGVAGLADYMAINKLDFVGREALIFNKDLIKEMSLAAKEQSFNMCLQTPQKEVYDSGMINSTFIALMPTASTSVLAGVNESFEAFQSNYIIKQIDAGEFLNVNSYLIKELIEIGIWTKELKESIMSKKGSVQHLDISEDMKQRYKTIWEHKQKDLIDLAIARQQNVDQSQSMNLYFKEPTTGIVGGALNYAWKNGLPTGSYYTRTPNKLEAPVRLAVDNEVKQTSSTNAEGWQIDCYGCST